MGLAGYCDEEERLLPLQVPRAAAGLVLEAGLLWGGEFYVSLFSYLPFCINITHSSVTQFPDIEFIIHACYRFGVEV